MKAINPCVLRIFTVPSLILFSIFILSGCKSSDQTQGIKKQAVLPTPLNTYCEFPFTPPSADQSLSQFSYHAWGEFISLNWPADTAARGQPNCSKAFNTEGWPKTWETFATTDQLFLENAQPPRPWSNNSLLKLSDQSNTTNQLVTLHYRSKAPDSVNLPPSIRQAVGGWLVDQNLQPTYYLVSVNQTSYNYIRDNQFYNAAIADQAKNITFPNNAIEVKTAWKVMGNNDDASRYYTIKANVETFDASGQPTGQFTTETVGMVGMHIVFKPKELPQWSWATFEHIDNTPTKTNSHAAYYNPNCSGAYCKPNQSPIQTKQPFNTPNQLTRVTAVDSAVQLVNREFQQSLKGTVFANYQLISPQWPSAPNDPGQPQGNPTPAVVANTVMESYIQAESSCMDCHSTARNPNNNIKSDYSFLLLFANYPANQQGK